MIENIDFKNGKVVQTNFVMEEEMDELGLTEDMLLVEYPSNYLLDVSWYDNGLFIMRVIHNEVWESPVFTQKTKDISKVTDMIEKGVSFIEDVVDKGSN